jgi:hypothetical protein
MYNTIDISAEFDPQMFQHCLSTGGDLRLGLYERLQLFCNFF